MNAKYLIAILIVGLVLSGSSCCIDRSHNEGGQESAPGTPQTSDEEMPDAGAGELTEHEMDDLESDLAELETLLGEIDAIDGMDEVNESTFT